LYSRQKQWGERIGITADRLQDDATTQQCAAILRPPGNAGKKILIAGH